MVFKLVRVDSEESQIIGLVGGTHTIGRGKFLHNDDNDKRVSRQHAELEVADDKISLKSLHQNPCFYIKKSTQDAVILHQNHTITLLSGDKFGLLPDNFWYEINQCSDSAENLPINKDNMINIENATCKKITSEINVGEGRNDSGTAAFVMAEENKETSIPGSPSLLSTEPTDQESTQAYTVKNEEIPEPGTPTKRSHGSPESSPVDTKKVKIEPNSPGPQAGPSNHQASSNADDVDQKPNVGGLNSPAKPAAPALRRERCLYGANCYRRNPEHKARFSHPSDSDWGTGPQGVCPYGSSCRRTDPRHWQHHQHPPGVNPPPPNGRRQGQHRKKRVKRRASESEDSDDGDSPRPDLIVTGKRSRKTINRDVTGFLDSEEDEDPYKTDESDEWHPSSDFTNSEDFSQK